MRSRPRIPDPANHNDVITTDRCTRSERIPETEARLCDAARRVLVTALS